MADSFEHFRRIGMTEGQAAAKAKMLVRCDQALDEVRADRTRWSIWVPGRLEIFGKHTDYGGGRSLLCAAERGFVVRAAPRRDARVRAVEVSTGERTETALDPLGAGAASGWPRYVDVVARRLARNFSGVRRGVDLAFDSDLPVAAGMSSSSALMIAVFVSLGKANDLRSSEEFRREVFTREELATYLGCMENGETFRSLEGDAGVGTKGGSQDHTAILCSSAGRVIQYSFSPVRREAVYRLSPSHTFVVASSGVVAEKTGAAREAYNRASSMVGHLLAAWNAATGRRDGTLADAVRSSGEGVSMLRHMAGNADAARFTGAQLVRRLDQFVLEAFDLVPAVGSALARDAVDELGPLADRSQRAAEEWLGNQVPETIALARIARELGATAASSFGAGFGGSVWALVPTGVAPDYVAAWEAAYRAAFPDRASRSAFFLSAAGPGAMQW
ncbi:MAG: GHMP family kinase ATP-binding protein [Gemmatimonadaceae bacterium]